MPIYFFHTDGVLPFTDEVGSELLDDDAAHLEAVRLAGALVVDEPESLRRGEALCARVVDEAGSTLFTVVARSMPGAVPEKTQAW